jgi:hypothetical protein
LREERALPPARVLYGAQPQPLQLSQPYPLSYNAAPVYPALNASVPYYGMPSNVQSVPAYGGLRSSVVRVPGAPQGNMFASGVFNAGRGPLSQSVYLQR